VAAIPFAALIKGMVTGAYNYTVRNVKIKMPQLPMGFNGIRIIHISDIHIGSFMSTEPMKKAVKMINDQKADLILFTGDLVNNVASETDGFLDILRELKAPMGVYSTLGNHDYGDYHPFTSKEEKIANLNRLKSIHEQVGFKLLLNQNTTLERNGDKISLIGMENWGAYGHFSKYGDMKKSLEGMESTPIKILMSHDPSHWTEQVSKEYTDIDLTLAGHTHGMQFGIEIPGFKWSPIQYMYKHWAGLYTSGKQYLYVNRGLGFLGYPGRVGIMPEITVIELVS
jgi:predicted MPP superfamily phosphohydrolase